MSARKMVAPIEGVTFCRCGAKYWDLHSNSEWRCASCNEQFDGIDHSEESDG